MNICVRVCAYIVRFVYPIYNTRICKKGKEVSHIYIYIYTFANVPLCIYI